jgi:hypothetical protein
MGHEMGVREPSKAKHGKRNSSGGESKQRRKKPKRSREDITCLMCDNKGHFMSDCPLKPSKEEQQLRLKKH